MEQQKLHHIGFLIDGNRRWARQNNKTEREGYDAGADNVYAIAKACVQRHIPYVTFWGLSTENFKNRTGAELDYIFNAIKKTGLRIEAMKSFRAGLRVIGNVPGLPKAAQDFVAAHIKPFSQAERLDTTVIAGLNYGGRDEIIRAVRRMIKDRVQESDVDEQRVSSYLDTAGIPDPELIIRTGGKKRLSGFMPWQTVYSELYFIDKLWPDFTGGDLDQAIAWFSGTERNFGK